VSFATFCVLQRYDIAQQLRAMHDRIRWRVHRDEQVERGWLRVAEHQQAYRELLGVEDA
jgi:hypothetical protein